LSTTQEPPVTQKFRISATFNAEPLLPVLEFWAKTLGAESDVEFAPYNQPLQTLLDPASVFAHNRDGVNVLLVRWEDLGQFAEAGVAALEANAHDLIRAARSAEPGGTLIFCLCPPSPAFAASHVHLMKRLNEQLGAALEDVPGVQYLGYDAIARLYPVDRWDNPQGEELGRIPYTDAYFVALGTSLVRLAVALHSAPYKVIALDCDNTMWKGICGEDGPEGVVLDEGRRILQKIMREQRDAGMLLTMASKNNERDVMETLARNPLMPLRLPHFTAWRINWDDKPANLASLAEELSLGLDSFIFLDDNPKECAEVEDVLPEVLCLTLPGRDEEIPHFLHHIWAFDHPVVTEEDRHRNSYYAQSQEFGRAIRGASDLQHFYDTLQLRVTVDPLAPEHLTRAAQLTQRTNQFNLTTIRRTEAELMALAEKGNILLTATASDRFGDYGVIGLVILEPRAKVLYLDTFLLSCRALGRGVEYNVLRHVGRLALDQGLETVLAPLNITAKNQPARQFLESIAEPYRKATSEGFEFAIPSTYAASVEWKAATPAAAKTGSAPKKRNKRRRLVDYIRIARELGTADQILSEMRRQRMAAGDAAPASDPPVSETELRLAAIWSDLLERAAIGRGDNFFDLGGHSLLAVLLLVRVKEAFGVDLHIDDVYSATMTLAGMASTIEARQMGAVDAGDYASLLAEIENLSDEEVRALLEQEQTGQTGD
jgi:FkbH-like protein